MRAYLLLVVATLLALTGCDTDLGNPQEIAARTESALRPYFPHASAVVQPQTQTIYGMACVELGRKLIEQIGPALAGTPEVKRLRRLRSLDWVPGNHTYRYFVIGFENQLVVYDVDADAVKLRDASPDYHAIYQQRCLAPQNAAAPNTLAIQAGQ